MTSPGVGVYIHIPFCQARCSYCDFNTYAGLEHLAGAYIAALCAEIEGHAASPLPGESADDSRPQARTIYIGGGTPSILSVDDVQRILAACQARFLVAPDAEVTMEANPGTASPASLARLRNLGVNRLSLGVQSLDDAMLRLLGRVHTAQQAREAYLAARSAGFANISLDFIYGLPGQTLAHWRATLHAAIALQAEHLSLYALTVEENTPLARRVAAGEITLPDDDSVADMYTLAEDVLEEAGYLHYEISNWAASAATQSLHNTLYWRRQPYCGFGAGAHSFDGARRSANVLHPRDYIARIQAGQSPQAESEVITSDMVRAETMYLGLRLLQEGVARADQQDEPQPLDIFAPQIDELTRVGLLESVGERVRLTRRGRLLSNQVFIRFLA